MTQAATTTTMDPAQFVDEKALSKLLDLSLATIRRWRFAGEGPKIFRFGKSVRYRMADVEQWIRKQEGR